MKKSLFAAIAAAAVLTFAMPAAAETFTASNGVLSIELPNENWKEMVDPSKWIALSDGANLITIEHYSNGEKLPNMSIANDHYVNVYQAVFSTQNEVFIITGSVVDAAKIPEIANAIISTKVLQYDTKKKIVQTETENVSSSEFSVASLDKTMYVTSDGLNVRSGYSTDDAVIGGFGYGSSVQVTGSVQKNGADYGWYRVAYNNGSGYVSASFLSDTAPAAKTDSSASAKSSTELQFTGRAATIYALSGTAVTIYEATTGEWYDSIGAKYTWISGDRLTNEGGEAFTTYHASGDSFYTGNTTTIYSMSGTAVTIHEGTDGYWYTDNGTKIWWLDSERLESEGGEAFRTYVNNNGVYDEAADVAGAEAAPEEDDTHKLMIGDSEEGVIVYPGGGAYYDDAGNEYHRSGDGWVDSYGNYYNAEW